MPATVVTLQVSSGYIQLFSCLNEGFVGDFSNGTATLSLWIKLDSSNPAVPNNGFANIGSWCYPSFYPSAVNTLSLKLFLSRGYSVSVSLPAGTVLSAWHNFAVTVDTADIATGYKVYLDGVLLGAFPMDGSNGNFLPPQNPRLGACFDIATNSWSWMYGKVDEIRIYNQALTQPQLSTLIHWPDLDNNSQVDFADLSSLSTAWLLNCSAPDWCGGTDINRDSVVNFQDFTYLANQWLQAVP
jgi:hypothetical protein